MTTPNGDQGATPTVKEYLAKIDGKLDTLNAAVQGLQLEQALVKQRVALLEKNDENRELAVSKLESKFSNVLAGIGTGIFAAAVYFVQSLRGA